MRERNSGSPLPTRALGGRGRIRSGLNLARLRLRPRPAGVLHPMTGERGHGVDGTTHRGGRAALGRSGGTMIVIFGSHCTVAWPSSSRCGRVLASF